MKQCLVWLIASFGLTLQLAATQAQAQASVREITRIAGEIYRFRNNFHYSVFAVTPAGVIATDPINADAARWLKAELVLFAVDFIPVNSVAFRDFPDAYMPDWIDSLKRVEAMDFDILAPGHGPLGNKDHVRGHRVFLKELRDEVLKLVREGKTLAEVKQAVKLPKYETWAGYKDMFEMNVEGMYRLVQGSRRPN